MMRQMVIISLLSALNFFPLHIQAATEPRFMQQTRILNGYGDYSIIIKCHEPFKILSLYAEAHDPSAQVRLSYTDALVYEYATENNPFTQYRIAFDPYWANASKSGGMGDELLSKMNIQPLAVKDGFNLYFNVNPNTGQAQLTIGIYLEVDPDALCIFSANG